MSYGAPSQSPPGGIDFGIVSEAFTLLTEHWKVYTVAGIVVLVASAPNQILTLPQSLAEAGIIEWTGWTTAPFGVLSLSLTLITYLFQALMAAGVTCYTLNVIRGKPASPSDIWIGFKDPLGYVWLMILSGIVGLLGIIACCIGVFVTTGLMMFVYALKVDRSLSATDAVAESWQMLKREWGMAAVFIFVIGFISGIGVIACGIGFAFTFAFQYIAAAILYNRFIGWAPQHQQPAPSPYPRGGQAGYAAPPQRDIGEEVQPPKEADERPRPPMDDPPPQPRTE